LKGKEFDWKEVDALLEIGDRSDLPSRTSGGPVEMQPLYERILFRGVTSLRPVYD
jgi:hypothetical protein